jgi:tetratricopeptide (TPR) repeat protein
MGRFEESIRHYENALELDPFSLQINMNIATTYYLRDEYERAINHLNKTSELEPNYMPTRFVLGSTYVQQGRLDEAIEQSSLSISSMRRRTWRWALWVMRMRSMGSGLKRKLSLAFWRKLPRGSMFLHTACS